jgi:hypothetical protein
MTGSAKQSRSYEERLDCFVASAPRNDGLATPALSRPRRSTGSGVTVNKPETGRGVYQFKTTARIVRIAVTNR